MLTLLRQIRHDIHVANLYSLVLVATLSGGCASGHELVGLRLAAGGTTMPEVGTRVPITVRALYDDGSTIDVTDLATCTLAGAGGTLDGVVFTATAPGAADVTCEFQGASDTLGFVVAGNVVTTIALVQRGQVPAGSRVELDAVVFAVAPGPNYVDFWGQDLGGGAWSGVYFRDARPAGSPAVAEGDRVRVIGVAGESRGHTIIDVEEVSTTGTATPVADVVAIAALAEDAWDGCLVRISDVEVTNPDVDGYVWEVASRTDLSGPTIQIDTLLHDFWPARGDRFARITGPLYPLTLSSGALGRSIVPRRAADVEAR